MAIVVHNFNLYYQYLVHIISELLHCGSKLARTSVSGACRACQERVRSVLQVGAHALVAGSGVRVYACVRGNTACGGHARMVSAHF